MTAGKLGTATAACALVVAGLLAPSNPAAAAKPSTPPPRLAPPQSHPHGETYGELAARWWQWALEAPEDDHPLLDATGEDCAENQLGHVWFLGGTIFGLGPVAPVTRTCRIPTGTALFFPLINNFYGAFLNDPPETRTEEFIRSVVACVEEAELLLEIDGVEVEDISRYFVESPLFDVQLPEDNIFGATEEDVPQLLLSPSVDAGYYAFLHPLPPGEHVIHWEASDACGTVQNVTYTVIVEPGRGRGRGRGRN